MSNIDYLTESDVERSLNWTTLIPAMESALSEISAKTVVQPPRILMEIAAKKGAFLAMPGFSSKEDSLGCKLVTSFLKNKNVGLPSILANMFLFDSNTGKLNAILEGTTITGWRTAGTSAAATKHLHKGTKGILAILGSGVQAKTHALALQHEFKFKQVKIWSRTYENAVKLCQQLGGPEFIPCESGEMCVKDADVICTTTYATEPIVKHSWLKPGVLINSVGFGCNHYSELEVMTYRNAYIFVDQMESANKELKGLVDMGIKLQGEVGEVINGTKPLPSAPITLFISLGMAIEDVLAANIVYKDYKQRKINTE